jgi:glucose/arabinose dehydrogenase
VGEERLLRNVGDPVRDVRQGPDGALYVVTDDKSDGRVLKLVPKRRTQ